MNIALVGTHFSSYNNARSKIKCEKDFQCWNFLQIKNLAFRKDLFSQNVNFEIFHVDYFWRTNLHRGQLCPTSRIYFCDSDPVTQFLSHNWPLNQPTFRWSNSAMETPKQFVKFVQRHQNDVFDVILVSLLLTLNRFQTPIRYFFR